MQELVEKCLKEEECYFDINNEILSMKKVSIFDKINFW
jgi:hypothetical protein